MMRLRYLPANAAYVFVFGDTPTPMGDEMFFRTRKQAVAQAARQGLKVSKDGKVTAVGPNPFENMTAGRRVRRNRAGGKLEVNFVMAPAHWAPALINGDFSGYSDEEDREITAFMDRISEDGWYVVSTKGRPHLSQGTEIQMYIVHRHLGS